MKFILNIFIILILASCASGKGVGRIKKYDFSHQDIPQAFDGYKIAFISDLHYKSLFTQKRLNKLVNTLNKLGPDVLLMGGDYHEGCRYVPELFEKLSQVNAPDGIGTVLGNNDYEACYDEILAAMKRNNIRLLEHTLDTINRGNESIIIAGVRNPFDLKQNGESPTGMLRDEDFVILLVHTPDYAQQVPIDNTDLVLAGHTHGGQVTLFGLYAPVIPSKYGQKFRTGLRNNSQGTPVVITNGVGTSNKNMRIFAPSEVVLVKLKTKTK
ncbi:metallophosphoesterase [Bacteroides sp. 519]|uniref:metallophosphoesterase n=1 Tax=Bacteroides sp. 519 TaxID=2302937 RepID=UPI0013D1AEDC|nr:metallophosphoesterase [Bacteroides sp. 519]NDV56590.1 metallophosphoesterase [Bacteroides sp. 519]